MGNDQEYVEYVSARLPALRRFAYVLCGDAHQADDLVQRTITTLFVRWAKIRQADNLDRYVRAMLAHAFIDERRLAWSRVRLFRDPPERAVHDDGVDDRTAVRAALAKVPRRQQVVLVLRFIYDLPVGEVAEILGCSAGTVKSQTFHGLATLRRLLGDQPAAALAKER